MAGAENQVLPVQRVEAATDDIDIPAMFGQLYARHRPRIRRIAHARVDGGLRAAEAGPLNAGLLRQLGSTARPRPIRSTGCSRRSSCTEPSR